MKVYLLSVRYAATRETEVKGIFSSEEVANARFKQYQADRDQNREKLRWEDWHLAELEVDADFFLTTHQSQ